jgi:hypothetical protein
MLTAMWCPWSWFGPIADACEVTPDGPEAAELLDSWDIFKTTVEADNQIRKEQQY